MDHPTGPTDVVLRVESGGGFIPFGYMVTQAPMFTLYGDNSVIFRPTSDPQGAGLPPFVKAVLSADQADAWPWQDLKVADFPIDPGNPARRMALINVDRAAEVTSVPSGGVLGLGILSADGTRQFSLSLRPMLPGDTLQPQNLP